MVVLQTVRSGQFAFTYSNNRRGCRVGRADRAEPRGTLGRGTPASLSEDSVLKQGKDCKKTSTTVCVQAPSLFAFLKYSNKQGFWQKCLWKQQMLQNVHRRQISR